VKLEEELLLSSVQLCSLFSRDVFKLLVQVLACHLLEQLWHLALCLAQYLRVYEEFH
jgi:hypothetical protein